MNGYEQFRNDSLYPDLCLIGDGKAAAAVSLMEGKRLCCAEKTVVVIDQTVPPNSPEASALHKRLAALAEREQTGWYYGRGMAGHLLIEKGLTGPGRVIVGGQEDIALAGAVGALGITLEPEALAEALRTGRCAFERPVREAVRLEGALPESVSAKAAALMLIKKYGADGLRGRIVCFLEEEPGRLTLRERMILCGMIKKAGAVGAYFEAEELEDFGNAACFSLSAALPAMAMPGGYSDIREAAGVEIPELRCVYIGGSIGGFLEDIRLTAKRVRGRRIAERVRLIAAPATAEIYCQAADAGYISDILDAGGMVINQCGSPAVSARIGDGEWMVSNDWINTPGYAGGADSGIVITSTETAVRYALNGGRGFDE